MDTVEKGISLLNSYHFQEAIKLFLKLEQNFESTKETTYQVKMYLGQAYAAATNYIKALTCFKSALIIAEELENQAYIFEAYFQLGRMGLFLQDYSSANRYFSRAEKIALQEDNSEHLAKLYNAQGASCVDCHKNKKEKLNLGIKKYKKAYEQAIRANSVKYQIIILANIGSCYSQLNKIEKAFHYLFQAEKLEENAPSECITGYPFFAISETYFIVGELELALSYLKRAIKIYVAQKDRGYIAQCYELFSKIYRKQGNFELALNNYMEYTKRILEIKNNVYVNVVSKLQMEYDLLKAEKDREIYRIKNEKLKQKNQELSRAYEEVSCLSEKDFLTSIYNRRGLFHKILNLNEKDRHGIILYDIDYFKQLNDQYGHSAGDAVLKELTERISKCLDENCILSRWGGEEFIIILPNRDLMQTYEVCKKIFEVNKEVYGIGTEKLTITITAGVDTFLGKNDFQEAIKRADEKLYYGKKKGRNNIQI